MLIKSRSSYCSVTDNRLIVNSDCEKQVTQAVLDQMGTVIKVNQYIKNNNEILKLIKNIYCVVCKMAYKRTAPAICSLSGLFHLLTVTGKVQYCRLYNAPTSITT